MNGVFIQDQLQPKIFRIFRHVTCLVPCRSSGWLFTFMNDTNIRLQNIFLFLADIDSKDTKKRTFPKYKSHSVQSCNAFVYHIGAFVHVEHTLCNMWKEQHQMLIKLNVPNVSVCRNERKRHGVEIL